MNSGKVVSPIVIVWVALEALPQSSVAVNTLITVYAPGQVPATVVSTRPIVTVPQLSVAEASSIGCVSEHSAV